MVYRVVQNKGQARQIKSGENQQSIAVYDVAKEANIL